MSLFAMSLLLFFVRLSNLLGLDLFLYTAIMVLIIGFDKETLREYRN